VGNPVSQAADVPSPARLSQLITGFRITQAIYVAATLGIADLLDTAPRSVEVLAETTGNHAPSLERLLLMLASVGLFTRDADGRFRNTALSELLQNDHPHSMRGLALMYGAPWTWTPWGTLDETIKTGRGAVDRLYGCSMFDYLARDPSAAAIFNLAMSSTSARDLPSILGAYDFSGFDCIVDVGGGHGALLQAILHRHPAPRGILADLPLVVANARCALHRRPDRFFQRSTDRRRLLRLEADCARLERPECSPHPSQCPSRHPTGRPAGVDRRRPQERQ